MYYKEIELDKPRKFRYDYNAIADVEEKAGMGIGEMFSAHRMGYHVIRLLVWGGLRWENRGLTTAQAGKMIGKYLENGGSLTEIVLPIKELLVKAKIIQEIDDDEGADEEELEGNMEAGAE